MVIVFVLFLIGQSFPCSLKQVVSCWIIIIQDLLSHSHLESLIQCVVYPFRVIHTVVYEVLRKENLPWLPIVRKEGTFPMVGFFLVGEGSLLKGFNHFL